MVDEAQLWTVVGEVEHHVGVREQRGRRLVQAELAAHAEVREQGVAVVDLILSDLLLASEMVLAFSTSRGCPVLSISIPSDR